MEYFKGVSGEDPSICGDGVDLPGEKFAAGFHGIYGCILDSAAAGDFHAHDGDAFKIVLADDLGKLFTVIHRVKLRASDNRYVIADKFPVEIAVRISSTVCCHQKIGTVKVRCVYRN